MKHTIEELLDITYQYYPRVLGGEGDPDARPRDETEEHRLLVAARKQAATDAGWRASEYVCM